LSHFEDLILENEFGRIHFLEPVDLTGITNLDSIIVIQNGFISLDKDNALGLNVKSELTFKQAYDNPIILWSEEFDQEGEVLCPNTKCSSVQSESNTFSFVVESWSSFGVEEEVLADLQVSELTFDKVKRGDKANQTFTIKNLGSYANLEDISLVLNVDADYSAKIKETSWDRTLAPGESLSLTLEITVPEREDSGLHQIGSLEVKAKRGTELISRNTAVSLSPLDGLAITNLEINGKTSGDLTPEGDNTIEVEVENEYTEDIEDIIVIAKLLDVDGDDLEEESDSFDLDVGDDDTVTLTFDLSEEKLDEDSYVLEITVEGEATDDSEQITILTKTVNVDREKHRIIIKSLDLGSSTLECLRQTSLRVEVENVGKSNEDEVEIRISNTQLGIDQTKSNIELDKYSGNDVNYESSFSFDLEDTPAGSYSLTIEVYRGGDLEDSDEVTLEVKDCSQTKSQTINTLSNEELAKQLEEQVKQQVQASKAKTPITTIKTVDFRDTQAYMNLLMVLVVLLVLAIILGLIAAGRRRR